MKRSHIVNNYVIALGRRIQYIYFPSSDNIIWG